MRRLAIYGKGGIGKSTTTSHLSAALVQKGYRVMQIGCDPKADSTKNLMGGRGIISAFEKFQPDIVIYDVLGDVVCGGFAKPIRGGYAKEVFIVSFGKMMSLYATNNIAQSIRSFGKRGYAKVGGLILNARNVENGQEIVVKACQEMEVELIQYLPRSPEIQQAEALGVFCTLGYYADSAHGVGSIQAGVSMVSEKNTVIGSPLAAAGFVKYHFYLAHLYKWPPVPL